jgi:hypothetical protein
MMRKNFFSFRFAILMAWTLFSAVLVGCDGGATSSMGERQPGDPITISGKLGSGLSVAQGVARGGVAARSIAGAVSGIASISVMAGSANVGPETEILPILPDGSFSATLQPEADASWLLLLVNESYATLDEKAAGFISFRDQSGVDLSLLPLGNAKRDLEFGSVSADASGVASEFSLADRASGFSESFAALLETAYRDNVFKHAKNLYVNLDATSGQWIMERTRCYATGTTAHAENAFMPVEQWEFTPGFNMRIDAQNPDGHDYDSIASGLDDIEIVPPEAITLKNTDPLLVFSPESPLLVSVARALPSGNALWFSADTGHPEPDGGYFVEFDGEENLGNGLWRFNLLKGGARSELALFDIQSADPFTADADPAFLYYLPSMNIATDTASKILSVAVSWFAWDPLVRTYRAVMDPAAFNSLVGTYTTGLVSMKTDPDGINYNDEESSNNEALFLPARAWYLGDVPADGTGVDWVRVNYAISGVEYFFTLYNEP